jgi:hypothetical protein
MSLILHHLLKDIRAQRWLLALVLIVIAAQIGVNLLEMQTDYHLASIAEAVRTTMALPLIGTALWILLLARLIQSEPVIGDASFWLTRPIPRSVYIPSKLLFILLFLIIPFHIAMPLDMLQFDVKPAQIGDALKSGLLLDLFLLLLVLWMATFTRTMVGFWCGLIVLTLVSTLLTASVVPNACSPAGLCLS